MTNRMTMTNAVIECILSRSAAKYYDPVATLSDDQIRELVRIGTTAPISFQLQSWRFIAVRTLEAKGHATDPKRYAAIQFARKVSETHGKVSDADLKAVRNAGYTDANVMKIVALVAMYSLTNSLNNVFAPESPTDNNFCWVLASRSHHVKPLGTLGVGRTFWPLSRLAQSEPYPVASTGDGCAAVGKFIAYHRIRMSNET